MDVLTPRGTCLAFYDVTAIHQSDCRTRRFKFCDVSPIHQSDCRKALNPPRSGPHIEQEVSVELMTNAIRFHPVARCTIAEEIMASYTLQPLM